MIEHHDDPELDAFVADVAIALDRDIGSRAVPRNFADVLERAHALDPKVVPADAAQNRRASRRVIELRPHRESANLAGRERALDDLLDGARSLFEADIERARPTDSRLAQRQPGRSMGRWVGVGGGLAVAAALVLAVVGVRTSTQRAAERDQHQAVSTRDLERQAGDTWTHRHVDRGPATTVIPTEEPLPKPEPTVSDETPDDLRPEQQRPRPRRVSAPSLDERLRALDAEAQALWTAGEIDKAEAMFEKLVKLAGNNVLAQHAYADLFTIVRRKGHKSRQDRLWRAYLARFPSGKFADDARAGLCRHAAEGDRARCWTAYVRDMPRGSYKAEAARELQPERDTP